MTKPTITQSQKRTNDSLASLFLSTSAQTNLLFLKSSSDIGVQRNGGRNGARFAPQSFLSYFKKLNKKSEWENKVFQEAEVASEAEELQNFHESQEQEASRIKNILDKCPQAFTCHLGGGHDHVYPLLRAIGEKAKKIVVINIDAHADTRTDDEHHSGTPFRQFADIYSGDFFLYQIGLLPFANATSTLSSLSRGQSEILWRDEVKEQTKVKDFFAKIAENIDSSTKVVFSLDADALNGHEVPGVSAVNGHGLTRQDLSDLWKHYQNLPFNHPPILGIYELNPVYDSLSMISMRTLATFIYECLF